ncbi:MAG TPA: hypothetical protein VFH56_07990 [Acidimicrobiales bacterium]|nr:hypothetical protein [Acidimicrobiales bacterium]
MICAAVVAALASMPAAPHAGASAPQPAPPGAKPISPSKQNSTTGDLSLHSNQPTGAVMPTPAVYLVFWGSQWSNDPASAASALQGLFGNLYGKADTWGTILDQYCEGLPVGTVTCGTSGIHVQHPTSTTLAGVWFDSSAPEPSKTTTSQIAAEAVAAAAHFGNTAQTPNLNAQYVIASPSGTHPDNFPHGGFCAWHSSTSSSFGNIAYTNLPYVPDLGTGACTTIQSPRLIDGYESTETHEYAETVTDPFPSNGWLKGGSEIGDLCVSQDAYLTINKLTFDVQGLWSNAAGGCVTQG